MVRKKCQQVRQKFHRSYPYESAIVMKPTPSNALVISAVFYARVPPPSSRKSNNISPPSCEKSPVPHIFKQMSNKIDDLEESLVYCTRYLHNTSTLPSNNSYDNVLKIMTGKKLSIQSFPCT